jgi:hypothetical protein
MSGYEREGQMKNHSYSDYEISENVGTLIYNNEKFENVKLGYLTPANHNVEVPEVYVYRSRDEGLSTYFTTLIYMIKPDLEIDCNTLVFSGMVPVDFIRTEASSTTSFQDYKYYKQAEFRFCPYYSNGTR